MIRATVLAVIVVAALSRCTTGPDRGGSAVWAQTEYENQECFQACPDCMERVSEIGQDLLASDGDPTTRSRGATEDRESFLSEICPEVEEILACSEKHAAVCTGMKAAITYLINSCTGMGGETTTTMSTPQTETSPPKTAIEAKGTTVDDLETSTPQTKTSPPTTTTAEAAVALAIADFAAPLAAAPVLAMITSTIALCALW